MPRDPRLDPLFRPLTIGPVTAPNRFRQVPHCTGTGYLRPATLAAMRGTKAGGGRGGEQRVLPDPPHIGRQPPRPMPACRTTATPPTWRPWPGPCMRMARRRGSNCGTAARERPVHRAAMWGSAPGPCRSLRQPDPVRVRDSGGCARRGRQPCRGGDPHRGDGPRWQRCRGAGRVPGPHRAAGGCVRRHHSGRPC